MIERKMMKLTDGYSWQRSLIKLRKKHYNFSDCDDFSTIVSSWKDIVKEVVLYKNSRPEKIVDGILYIVCYSSTILYKLRNRRAIILSSCRALTKSKDLKDVKFIKK